MNHLQKISLLLFLTISLQAGAQTPMADIATDAAPVIIAGSTVQLDGTASTSSLYSWKLVRTPDGSAAELTTPSPSMPSFTAERPGLYVVELVVGDGDNLSEPEYLVLTAATPAGNAVAPSQTFSTPSLCALFRGFTGCTKTMNSFPATAGDYTLNVQADSLTDLTLKLNGEELPTPPLIGGQTTFSIPITLKANNQLEVTPKGTVGSFAKLTVVKSVLPSGMNAAPVVADLSLSTRYYRKEASGTLSITDADAGQTHTSEILSDTRYGTASLEEKVFYYTGRVDFNGLESVPILTYDSGYPTRGTVSKVAIANHNFPPGLLDPQVYVISKGDEPYFFRLHQAFDFEKDEITYSLVSQPSQGTLDCREDKNVFACTFTPPPNFDNSDVTFSYKANDGEFDSNIAHVTLRPVTFGKAIVQLALGGNQSCVLFSDSGVRCWGNINFPDFSGATSNDTDDSSPIYFNRFDLGENFVKIAVTTDTVCGLTNSGRVRCWGNPFAIGFRDPTLQTTITPAPGIDFGTQLKVVDIVSSWSAFCALFEDGRVKCWGENWRAQLGLGINLPFVGGVGVKPSDTGFIKIGERVRSLTGSKNSYRFCAILESGDVRCWGQRLFYRDVQEEDIGDNEHPESLDSISLGEPAVQIAIGDLHSCALLASGKLKCWGYNNLGQLGLGVPYIVGEDEYLADIETVDLAGETVKKVVVGASTTCVLLENGTVRCWGWNEYGQLGLGHTQNIGDIDVPTSVPAISFIDDIIDMDSGSIHFCTLLAKGSVRCWGWNEYGQLGLNHTIDIGDDEGFEHFTDAHIEDYAPVYPRMFLSSRSLSINEQLTVSAKESVFRGKEMSFHWDFGDGTMATGQEASRQFQGSGMYPVKLTLTDTNGESVAITNLVRVRPENYAPDMPSHQHFTIEKNKAVDIKLSEASDHEGDDITYSLSGTSSITGTLTECLGGTADLTCKYEPPTDFVGVATFAYQGNDGESTPLTSTQVTIQVAEDEEESLVVEVAMGAYHTCALYENKKIKCWGYNYSGQLGLGHNDVIGDDESLVGQPFVNVGGDVVQVAVGDFHTCAVLEGGILKCWGSYEHGALGGISQNISNPSQITPMNFGFAVKQVSLGNQRGCAVGIDGELACWGYNKNGILGLGNGTGNLGDSPMEIPDTFPLIETGGSVSKVAVGQDSLHICVLLKDGNVRCWGDNTDGSLGQGVTYSNIDFVGDDEHPGSLPPISLGQKALDIVVGDSYFCALLEDKNVLCWGEHPTLGTVSGVDAVPSSLQPINLGGGKAEKISLGRHHGCALLEDGSLRCWGGGAGLGNPTLNNEINSFVDTVPVALEGEVVSNLFTGGVNNCIILKNQDVRCWGSNFIGALGLGHDHTVGFNEYPSEQYATTIKNVRIIVPRLSYTNDADIARKIHFNAEKSFSRNDIKNYTWNFGDGMMATGETVIHTFGSQDSYDINLTLTDIYDQSETITRTIHFVEPPEPIFLPFEKKSVTAMAEKKIKIDLRPVISRKSIAGLTYALVTVPSSGTLSGCLGIGGVQGLSCVYTAPQTVGNIVFSYKASNGMVDSNVATVEIDVVKISPSPVQIASGYEHSCALYDNKKVKCWGRNNAGQLGLGHRDTVGDDELISEQKFVDVGGDVLQVEVGEYFSCALLSDRSVKCWGSNGSGQAGRGRIYTGTIVSDPSTIDSLNVGEDVQQISLGAEFTCALTVSGRVKCWGNNFYGQLGLGHTNDVVNVAGASIRFTNLGARAIKISAGHYHVCALLKEGRVRCWGRNNHNQLGYDHKNNIGDNEHAFVADNVPLPKKAIDVVAGGNYTCALLEDKKPFCWGLNFDGQLGITDGYSSLSNSSISASNSSSVNLGKGDVLKLYVGTGTVIGQSNHVCALLTAGKVQCWGSPLLGLGANISSDPVHIMNADRLIPIPGRVMDMAIHLGGWYALLSDGNVLALGNNDYGQLGLGHTNNRGFTETADRVEFSSVGIAGHPLLARFEYDQGSTRKNFNFSAANSFSQFPVTYSWDFGDMMTGTGGSVSHSYAKAGTYTVTLTATDSQGQTDTHTASVTVGPDDTAPYFYNASETITVTEGMTNSFELEAARDSEGDSLTYTLVTAPAEGTLANCLGDSGDLSCDYTPASDSTATNISFTYKANDGNLDSPEVFTVFLEIEQP